MERAAKKSATYGVDLKSLVTFESDSVFIFINGFQSRANSLI
jgi:hypothetical protein